MKLSTSHWTVVAQRGDATTRSGWIVNKWHWEPGFSHDEIWAASANDDVIAMHAYAPDGVLLVARLPGPAWQKWRTWCARNSIPMRVRR